jgi:hypothetical protein
MTADADGSDIRALMSQQHPRAVNEGEGLLVHLETELDEPSSQHTGGGSSTVEQQAPPDAAAPAKATAAVASPHMSPGRQTAPVRNMHLMPSSRAAKQPPCHAATASPKAASPGTCPPSPLDYDMCRISCLSLPPNHGTEGRDCQPGVVVYKSQQTRSSETPNW